ncbi:MAG: glycoside hydrolase TIM-barrel-like domain-containing protein, partial [Pseudomonadota bacterium]
MATILLSAAGAAAGSALGGSFLGLSTAVIGRAVGATLGKVLDQRLMGTGSEVVETGKVDRFRVTGAGEGEPLAQIFGRVRVGGQIIWASRFQENVSESGGGGKGSPPQPETRTYSYAVSLAVALCEGEITSIGRVWADGTEISRDSVTMRVYHGTEDQVPDPKMEAVEGTGNVPAYRGVAYVVIEDLALGPYGNRVPQFSFEVIRPADPDVIPDGSESMSRLVQAVALIPGTGEYSLATTPVRYKARLGDVRTANLNAQSGKTDFATSLEQLTDELPKCGALSLIVSWFGDDLRCGLCQVKPKVEQSGVDGVEMPWRVSGVTRGAAEVLAQVAGRSVYGGTPADASVVEAIRAAQQAGQRVMFYPFILMEQLAGNGRTDPWTGAADQPVLPWRGRITLSKAPGQAGSPDQTAVADTEVAALIGQAAVADFSVSGTTVSYTGPPEWSLRRFILHYAHLCAAAGGVEAFCIGSELRGLTQIRGATGFPVVSAFRQLARDVRQILGPDTKISYAADWSEYFGYHPQDGSGDVYFHLDPLWADPDIDFIGIDNYMPLSDWRDTAEHADSAVGSIYDLEYLEANVAGGEGYDWYYASDADREGQVRTAISDGAHGEPWVFRYKDLAGWWS